MTTRELDRLQRMAKGEILWEMVVWMDDQTEELSVDQIRAKLIQKRNEILSS